MAVASSGMAVQSFAFISIDFHIFERQTLRVPNLLPHFGRILRSGFASNRKRKTPWESLPLPSAPVTTSNRSFRKRACRSEEHTSELQSLAYLVCRLLLEKKKRDTINTRETDSRPT